MEAMMMVGRGGRGRRSRFAVVVATRNRGRQHPFKHRPCLAGLDEEHDFGEGGVAREHTLLLLVVVFVAVSVAPVTREKPSFLFLFDNSVVPPARHVEQRADELVRVQRRTARHPKQPRGAVIRVEHKQPVVGAGLQHSTGSVGRDPRDRFGVAQQHGQESLRGDVGAGVVERHARADVFARGRVDESPGPRVEGRRRGVVEGEREDLGRRDAVAREDVVGLLLVRGRQRGERKRGEGGESEVEVN